MEVYDMDANLVHQALEGNSIAYGKLIDKYFDKVCRYVKSVVGNRSDAEEITQDAFLKGYHSLKTLKNPNQFLSWMMSIAHNSAVNWLERKKEKVNFVSLENVSSGQSAVKPTEDVKDELASEIHKVIDNLKEKDRKLLEKYLEGKRYSELSEQYEVSEGALRVRIFRLKRIVRKEVLKRLRYIALAPWREILKVMGGLVMKLTTKLAITGVSLLMLAGVGIWVTHRREEKPVLTKSETVVKQTQTKKNTRKSTASRFVKKAPKTVTKTPQRKMSKTEESSVPEEVPTAQYSDDEIRAFLAWLSSMDRESSTDETEIENTNVEDKEVDYVQEKDLIESVIWEQWKKGYESYDVERYMSSIWEDDFFYTSDIGTPNDPSDDVIIRGGQQERESALRVFNKTMNIELNLSPRSDIEFLSDTNAMVEYDYEIIFSNYYQSFPEVKLETIFASGNITFILERRENSEGIGEWRILEWYDYAQK